jgi:hypothetical protein
MWKTDSQRPCKIVNEFTDDMKIFHLKNGKIFRTKCPPIRHNNSLLLLEKLSVASLENCCLGKLRHRQGRAISQAVSRRLSTAAVRVRAQVRSCGICGGQSGTGAGFLRVLQFPMPILILPTAPYSSSIVRGWYNRSVICRRNKWTQSHPTPRKN